MEGPFNEDERALAALDAISSDDVESLARLVVPRVSSEQLQFPLPIASLDFQWLSPLHAAARIGSLRCLRLLLDHGADPNGRDATGETAVFGARNGAVVRMLAEVGADLEATNNLGNDALQELLVRTLPHVGEDQAQTVDACSALLRAGVPLVFSTGWAGRLHRAAFCAALPAVKFLLDAGHPTCAEAGTTALHAVCWPCVYQRDTDDATSGIIHLLLHAGMTQNDRDEHGRTPLHEALSGDGLNMVAVKELVAAGADVNAQDSDGQTPLHVFYETLFNYGDVVPVMLQLGADPRIVDKWGRSVIDIAREMLAGGNPRWRKALFESEGRSVPCDWKEPASQGDLEHQMIELMERA
ncbi:MAG: ankyrin repeat domain-containing protein [Phycisphaerae bacterium]|nr:ankyrin repeat domain-containing protein [Phycisphaerae bacterium]